MASKSLKETSVVSRYCYETSDGKLFTGSKAAVQHQARLDAAEWYEENKLYGNYAGSYVEFQDLLDWLSQNEDVVRKLL